MAAAGKTTVRTYTVEELLATKLRALYQRKKGRDLFDLWYAAQRTAVDFAKVYALFLEYWDAMGMTRLARGELAANMADKHRELVFEDVLPLLAPGIFRDPDGRSRSATRCNTMHGNDASVLDAHG